jgi:Cu/Ag efflux pump CusA
LPEKFKQVGKLLINTAQKILKTLRILIAAVTVLTMCAAPMIGGLTSSTIFTLIVAPVLYYAVKLKTMRVE